MFLIQPYIQILSILQPT